MRIDLHTHTTASDGKLEPAELCQRAASRGVEFLSITDHDTCAAYRELGTEVHVPVQLIPGIEFSTYWQNTGIHILGLNIELQSEALNRAIDYQQKARAARAEQIAVRLEAHGISKLTASKIRSPLSGKSLEIPISDARILRNISSISAKSKTSTQPSGNFSEPGNRVINWAPMPQVIDWIRQARGMAVLAHPAKYGLTWTKTGALLDAFSNAGGHGMEVISGQQQAELTERLARLSLDKGLLASSGSDFHQPTEGWREVGRATELPSECRPVWEQWNLE
jgi:predicted metal-dependent phosphoesterase TrpH